VELQELVDPVHRVDGIHRHEVVVNVTARREELRKMAGDDVARAYATSKPRSTWASHSGHRSASSS
jgi:hypothetical protein